MTARLRAADLVLLFGLLLASCGESADPPEEMVDGPDDAMLVGGKADSAFGACELEQVLAFVNEGSTDAAALRAAGVHTRAAKSIAKIRAGQDGRLGTPDDEPIATLEALDAVRYVGPVALRQLVAAVADRCTEPQPATAAKAEVIFSPQPFEESHLAKVAALIGEAQRSIDIAMYSFRDAGIFEAIEAAVDRGVQVRMVFESANKHRRDPDGTMSARLEEAGVDVRYINKIMHHKFALIDGPRDDLTAAFDGVLVSGSANWSHSAGTRYDENTVFLTGHAEANLRFQQEFNHLWESARDFTWIEDLEPIADVPIADSEIVDLPGYDAIFTSANFRVHTTRYGPTFSVNRDANTIADRLVALIDSAQISIDVASGHLRSRAIAEALMRKHAERPDVDIKVYLDAQEYLSEGTHRRQVSALDGCLYRAGDDERDAADCMARGFLFAYEIEAAGIGLRFKYYSYRWHYSYAVQMHHKYLIVDGEVVAAGSYNYSDNAEHNTIENLAIYDRSEFPELVDAFLANHAALWESSRDLYEPLLDEIREGSDRVPLVFEPMALTWGEVGELKKALRGACPEVNSLDFRRHPEAHRSCTR